MTTKSISLLPVAAWLLAASTAHAQTAVDLGPDFKNPTSYARTKGKTTVSGDKLGFVNCEGHFIERPVAILHLKQPMKRLQITAPGAHVLVVKVGTAFACQSIQTTNETPTVLLDEWKAGDYPIYVGHTNSNFEFAYGLQIEDLTRPVDTGWAANVPHVKLDAAPKDALSFALSPSGARHEPRGQCGEYYFAEQPDLILDVTAPVVELHATATLHDRAPGFMLIGPLPADHRNPHLECSQSPSSSARYSRLEPGLYALKLGTAAAQAPAIMNLVLSGPDSKRDPLLPAVKIADPLPLADRDVFLHFPLVEWENITKLDTIRAGLYAAAPRSLFAFIKRDLEPQSAELVVFSSSGKPEWPTSKAPEIERPRKGEPVLLLGDGGGVLTADGLIFKVNVNDISDRPVGEVAFPAAPRDPQAGTEQLDANVGPEDAKVVAAETKATDTYNACWQRVWEPAGKQISQIEQGPYHSNNDNRIAAIKEATNTKAHARCNTDGWQKMLATTWTKLIESRTKRRATSLAAAKTRLAALLQ